jgi:hypothetical protein
MFFSINSAKSFLNELCPKDVGGQKVRLENMMELLSSLEEEYSSVILFTDLPVQSFINLLGEDDAMVLLERNMRLSSSNRVNNLLMKESD